MKEIDRLVDEVPQLSKTEQNQVQAQASAQIAEREHAGVWGGTVKAHTAYAHRPLEWITTYLKVPAETLHWSLHPSYETHRWDGDKDPLLRILTALAEHRDVGVESATGTGKTFLAACVTLWFLACHHNAIVAQWAPTERQLLLNMWKEIGALFTEFSKHFPTAELYTGKLRMLPTDAEGKEKWAATAFVSGVGADEEAATKAQGLHGEHMLIITEETPGIPRAIMVAIDQTRSADHNLHLALGNPDHRHDELHTFCKREDVEHIRISALDHPNIVSGEPIVPGAIGKNRLAKRITNLGVGSRLYLSRIRGISPPEAKDALIQYVWCETAAERFRLGTSAGREKMEEWEVTITDEEARGVDVANSEGGDEAAIARGPGRRLTEVVSFPCPDANQLGAIVAQEIERDKIDPRYVGVDPVGVGAGCVNELKRLGHKVRHLSGARKAIPGVDTDELWSETDIDFEGRERPTGARVVEAERFADLRSQMHWRMREDLRKETVDLVYDVELFNDLTTPTFKTANGVIKVESKEEIKKRLGRSPNKGDAVIYWNWVRRRTPVRVAKASVEVSTSDRDRSLEKFLVQQAKRQKKENRELIRRLKRRARNSKRDRL